MKRKYLAIYAIALSVASFTPTSYAEQGSLKQCQRIDKRIDKLDTLRRKGGSGKQMEKWRKQRHKLSDKAYHLNCRKFGILK